MTLVLSRLSLVATWLPLAAIRFYQRWISPALPQACRFHPTCSEYAAQALSQRGLVVGLGLTVWRVVRCNPFVAGGEDWRGLKVRPHAGCCSPALVNEPSVSQEGQRGT